MDTGVEPLPREQEPPHVAWIVEVNSEVSNPRPTTVEPLQSQERCTHDHLYLIFDVLNDEMCFYLCDDLFVYLLDI